MGFHRVHTVVECGDTSPGHAMHSLETHPTAQFIVHPPQRVMLHKLGTPSERPLKTIQFQSSLAGTPLEFSVLLGRLALSCPDFMSARTNPHFAAARQ